jgi:tetratricopeptide (TPR) repeat protein
MRFLNDPLVGRTIAQYEILTRVGGGAMGVVYRARDTKLGRVVALKFLPQKWNDDENAKQRFLREAQAASATDHPNICTIHDIETADDGQLFIVMALYEGRTLKQRLESGPLPVDDALDIATQIADGLAKAHAQGVVHRDIKPGNIMVTEDGVRILDFGLATFVDALKLTGENVSFGTPAYMSPEQVRGEAADARSDVWAAGAVLYEMLAGHAPFQGAYAEAVGYAIQHESPMSLRTNRPEVREDIEQLVFRALHKDPDVRFQSGRAFARALREARGLSVPLDLRTQALPVADVPLRARSRRRVWPRTLIAVAAGVVLVVGMPAIWLLLPSERSAVMVAPVVNQTGRAELDAYRLALTEIATDRLAQSRDVRPVSYRRLLQTLQRFSRGTGGDVTSRDAVQSMATDAGSGVIILPTLLYDNASGSWRARVEFRDARTAINLRVAETKPVVSSLSKDTAYGLMTAVTDLVDEHFASSRTKVLASIGSIFDRRAARMRAASLRTLDAVDAYERGVRAYESLEYADALQAFQTAASLDTRHPLPAAWISRVARLMTQWEMARESGAKAVGLISAQTPPSDALFARAVSAEAERQNDDAGELYRALTTRFSDEPLWLLELAAFQDRAGLTADSVSSYHALLARDARMIRPHLELCRLYNSTRMNESGLARQQGAQARDLYAAAGDTIGEGLAMLCLADILRVGSPDDRADARRNAERAKALFERAGARYNLARAFHYMAVTRAREDPAGAIVEWEQSLVLAETVKNTGLEATVLLNLGTANGELGNRTKAADYYRRTARTYEARGDEQGAAYYLANAGALLIAYGTRPDDGLRDAQNALAVVQNIDKNFEAFCLRTIAKYHRQVGNRAEAERLLQRAEAIARERNLPEDSAAIAAELGRLSLDFSDYERAKTSLRQAMQEESGADRIEAQISLARAEVMLGEFASARDLLNEAGSTVDAPRNRRLIPQLQVTRGLLAYESGQPAAARAEFARASAPVTTDLIDQASVEARAYVGWLDARAGRLSEGKAAILASLEDARRMRRAALEARCRTMLVAVLLLEHRVRDAIAAATAITLEGLGPELQAAVHQVRADSHLAGGDREAARREVMLRDEQVQRLRQMLSSADGLARRTSMVVLLANPIVR